MVRKLRQSAGLAGAVALGVAVSLMMAVPAQAKPTPDQLRAQISEQNRLLEPIIEQYNTLRVHLAADQAKAKTLGQQLGPAQLQAATAQTRIGQIATTIYQTGGVSTAEALLSANSTNDLIDVLGSLNEVARQQAATVTDAGKVVSTYQAQSDDLNKLIAEEKQKYAQLSKQKATITAKVNALQALIDAAGGGGGTSSGNDNYVGSPPYTKAQLMPAACPSGGSGAGLVAARKACSLVWDLNHSPHWHMYGWGDAGPDKYDCSGLTMTAWAAAGVSLPHSSNDQASSTYTYEVSASSLQVGDLIAYYSPVSHIAIYVGGGWIVQAEETGQPVKMSRMDYDTPTHYRRVKG
jgi:peptidoglycan DL-endopeptidase CwlO